MQLKNAVWWVLFCQNFARLQCGVGHRTKTEQRQVTDAQEIGEAASPQMSVEQMRAICDEARISTVLLSARTRKARKACGVRCWPASIPSNTAACSTTN